MPERIIADLRSDTVTQATPEMRRAMAEAPVGDEGREGDPTAKRLEARAAEITGHQAALFCTSGTMGNLIALMCHLRPGEEVLAERGAHFLRYEAGGVSAIVGAIPRTLVGLRGAMNLDELEAAITQGSDHTPRTALIAVENTHNTAGGTCLSADYMLRLWEIARGRGVPVHLDGARVWNAAVALGVPVKSLTHGCDSVMTDLSKGLGAPYGSLLSGSREFIARACYMRKRIGGGVRQIGHMAAAGLVALDTMVDRLAEDHANARRLAEGIHRINPDLVDLGLVETNMVMLDTGPLGQPAVRIVSELDRRGIRCLATGPQRIRLVTHYDVSPEQVAEALSVFADVLGRFLGR